MANTVIPDTPGAVAADKHPASLYQLGMTCMDRFEQTGTQDPVALALAGLAYFLGCVAKADLNTSSGDHAAPS
jgi:hypothetical protein